MNPGSWWPDGDVGAGKIPLSALERITTQGQTSRA